VQRIALAERLDQLRHAHLWPDPERRRRAHQEALSVYSPLAERASPKLARRYAWWCSMFARKYLAGL
jgi:(p)ppGpp synthase/HD superfamily hydrolase